MIGITLRLPPPPAVSCDQPNKENCSDEFLGDREQTWRYNAGRAQIGLKSNCGHCVLQFHRGDCILIFKIKSNLIHIL